jgi:hypothetical protein
LHAILNIDQIGRLSGHDPFPGWLDLYFSEQEERKENRYNLNFPEVVHTHNQILAAENRKLDLQVFIQKLAHVR